MPETLAQRASNTMTDSPAAPGSPSAPGPHAASGSARATGAAEQSKLSVVVRWLLSITRPVHKPLMASLVFRVFTLSLDLVLFGVAAYGVVSLLSGGDGLWTLLLWLVVLSLLKAVMFYLEQFSGHYVAFKALELLRAHVFSTMWPKAPAIVTRSRSGDILASLTRDVDRIEVVYAHTFAPVVSAYIVGAAAIVVTGLSVGWGIVFVAALCMVISLAVVPYAGMRTSMRNTQRVLQRRRDLAHHVTDSVFGVDEVIGYGLEPQRQREMGELGDAVAVASTGPKDWAGLRRGANVMLSLVATLSIVWFGMGSLEPAVLAALAAAALRSFEAPRGIEDATGYLDHSLAAARRLYQISHSPEPVTDGPQELALDRGPEIVFEDVTYTYPARGGEAVASKPAVNGITLRMPAGGHTILVGRSGSGKSTLVQLLQRYDDAQSGSITVDDTPVASFTLDSLRRSIVSVSQKNQLLQATLAENLRLGAPDATDDQLWDALTVAGLADEVREMPEGLATYAGKAGSALSGGQAQRLCLARALLMEPRVLVLDEFTSNLDTAREVEIRAALRAWRDDLTIIEVTHRLHAAESADLVAIVDRGRIVASGTPAEISTSSIRDFFKQGVFA